MTLMLLLCTIARGVLASPVRSAYLIKVQISSSAALSQDQLRKRCVMPRALKQLDSPDLKSFRNHDMLTVDLRTFIITMPHHRFFQDNIVNNTTTLIERALKIENNRFNPVVESTVVSLLTQL